MNQIQIDITDKRVYAQIAFLVDSPTFLRLIEKVRSKYQITSPFKPDDYDAWHNHVLKLVGYNLDEYWKMEKIGPHDKAWNKKSNWMKSTEQNLIKMVSIENDFIQSVVKIRKLHHYPVLFDSVIRQAVLFHYVTSFKTAKAVLSYNDLPISPGEDDPIMAIIVSPNSHGDDILEAFEEIKKMKRIYEYTNPLDSKLDKDTLTHIERNRAWHWEQYLGKTYEKILNDWNNTCPYFKAVEEHPNGKTCKYCKLENQNMIERAVARYRHNLQLVIPKTDI